jgi:hypothetical protein
VATEVLVFPTPFAIAASVAFLALNILGFFMPLGENCDAVSHPPLLLCPRFKKTSLIPVANLICIAQLLHFLSAMQHEWPQHVRPNTVLALCFTPIPNVKPCLSANTFGLPFTAVFLYILTILCYWKTIRAFAVIVMHPVSTEAVYVHLPHAIFWVVHGAYAAFALVFFGVYIQHSQRSPKMRLVFVLCNTLLWIVVCIWFILPISINPTALLAFDLATRASYTEAGISQYAASSLAALNAISTPFLLLPKHERF